MGDFVRVPTFMAAGASSTFVLFSLEIMAPRTRLAMNDYYSLYP